MIYLDFELLVHVAERAIGAPPDVRDEGLLESALARPRSTVLGKDAYEGIHEKTAALFHSLARNHALVDGNKRLALGAIIAFYGLNGLRLTLTNDEAYALTVSIAGGDLNTVEEIAAVLQGATESDAAAR